MKVRKKCAHNDKEITFMSVIDVDLVGVWDRPWQGRIERDVECYPATP